MMTGDPRSLAAEEQTKSDADKPAAAAGQLDAKMVTWVAAALWESLVLVGGLWWIMTVPADSNLLTRVFCIAGIAVLGAGLIAWLIARSQRSDA